MKYVAFLESLNKVPCLTVVAAVLSIQWQLSSTPVFSQVAPHCHPAMVGLSLVQQDTLRRFVLSALSGYSTSSRNRQTTSGPGLPFLLNCSVVAVVSVSSCTESTRTPETTLTTLPHTKHSSATGQIPFVRVELYSEQKSILRTNQLDTFQTGRKARAWLYLSASVQHIYIP